MRKKILILLCILSGYYAKGDDTCNLSTSKLFVETAKEFIDSVKPGDYTVFVARFYHNKSLDNDFNFTLGYIQNSDEYDLMKASHYVIIGSEIFLLRTDDDSFLQELGGINVKRINSYERESVKIVQKLFPPQMGYFSTHYCSMTFQKLGCTYKTTFYDDAGEINPEHSVYDSYIRVEPTLIFDRKGKTSNPY